MARSKDIAILTPQERAGIALGSTAAEKQLVELASKTKHIANITSNDGYKQVHASRMELKTARLSIKNLANDAREDAKVFNKAVLDEEKRLIALISAEEDRLGALQDAWDAEKERLRKERDELERLRVESISLKIKAIASHGCTPLSKSVEIQNAINKANDTDIDAKVFFEMTTFAQSTKDDTLAELAGLMAAAIESEAYEEAMKVERKRLDAEAAEFAERKLLEEAKLEAEREKNAAKQRAEQEALDKERAEFAKQKAEHEAKIEAARLAEQQAYEAKLAAEREKIQTDAEFIAAMEDITDADVDAFTATLNAKTAPEALPDLNTRPTMGDVLNSLLDCVLVLNEKGLNDAEIVVVNKALSILMACDLVVHSYEDKRNALASARA